ncbi:hypothetical protein NT239_05865 [Chitinibacter sp. SCUT-21]|uniref:DUF2946 family protein n=1 Tax=Chitinibacter sp. SCUT-21 TaxID=2970891 RepID=UPI0035A57B21
MIAANFICALYSVNLPLFLRRKLAPWFAVLAMVAQLLLPFAHAAAMDAGVPLAWCGTGQAPSVNQDSSLSSSDAKIIVKCAICSVASLHAIAPPPAQISLPLLIPVGHSPILRLTESFSVDSYAIPPPPRGPPLSS